MATPAARMMLFKNGKSLPLHLLRGWLSGASSTTFFGPAVMSGAQLQNQASNFVQFLLGYQSTVVPAFGSTQSGAANGRVNGVDMIIDRSFGGFGEVVGRLEARGKKVVDDDQEDDLIETDNDDDYYYGTFHDDVHDSDLDDFSFSDTDDKEEEEY